MPVFLHAVDVPERCFLCEVLLWVAFQRLPIAAYDLDGKEIRENSENDGYFPEATDEVISEDECKRAGIPIDPRWADLDLIEEPPPFRHYNELEREFGPDEAMRIIQRSFAEKEQESTRAYAEWEPHYLRAIEYPASQIFVALKAGRLLAKGRQLPAVDYDQAMTNMKGKGLAIADLPIQDIPPLFWTLKGIDFQSSAAQNDSAHYCHIFFRTSDILSIFPGERETIVVERVGETYILNESARQPRRLQRGRPSYPWDRFHLEVSAMVQRNELPAKKEAAIQHFQAWFAREHGIRPSRAAIGEKLTPYYERFVRRSGQKN